MESLQHHLVAHIYSVDRVRHYLSIIEEALESVWYHSQANPNVPEQFQAAVAELATPAEASTIKKWGDDWLRELSNTNFKSQLQAVATWVEAAPRLTLYVPVALDEAAEIQLGQWCRQELTSVQFIDWSVEAATVGGCAFIINNRYYDYSLTPLLKERRQAVRNIIANYVS